MAQITKIPLWLPGNVPVATPRLQSGSQTVLNRGVDDVMPLHYGSPLKRSTYDNHMDIYSIREAV